MNMLVPISISNLNWYLHEYYRLVEKIYQDYFTNVGKTLEQFEVIGVSPVISSSKEWKNFRCLQMLVGRDSAPQLLDEMLFRGMLGWYEINLLKLEEYYLIEEYGLWPFDRGKRKEIGGNHCRKKTLNNVFHLFYLDSDLKEDGEIHVNLDEGYKNAPRSNDGNSIFFGTFDGLQGMMAMTKVQCGRFGKVVNEQFNEQGAKHLITIVLGDKDQCIADNFIAGREQLWPELDKLLQDVDDANTISTPYAAIYRIEIHDANVAIQKELQKLEFTQSCIHLEFDIFGTGIHWVQQKVKVLAREYVVVYKSLTNIWEDYLAMKPFSVEGQFKLYVVLRFFIKILEGKKLVTAARKA
ncbi:hypothetical protein I3843_06G060500 [Carya illinoinensis]|nr:hypothetical protein I3843_06G060500 [Carya illinoinensis]